MIWIHPYPLNHLSGYIIICRLIMVRNIDKVNMIDNNITVGKFIK